MQKIIIMFIGISISFGSEIVEKEIYKKTLLMLAKNEKKFFLNFLKSNFIQSGIFDQGEFKTFMICEPHNCGSNRYEFYIKNKNNNLSICQIYNDQLKWIGSAITGKEIACNWNKQN